MEDLAEKLETLVVKRHLIMVDIKELRNNETIELYDIALLIKLHHDTHREIEDLKTIINKLITTK